MIDYIIRNLSKDSLSLDKMSILKMIFFAERYSLRKFTKSITNDKFVAMEYGPVASGAYDILKFNEYISDIGYAKEILSKDGLNNIKSNSTLLTRDDYDELSDNDLEVIENLQQKHLENIVLLAYLK